MQTRLFKQIIPTAIILLVAISLIIWLFYQAFSSKQESLGGNAGVYWIVAGQEVFIEIVKTPSAMYQGLSNRPSLCRDCAMMFVFPESDQRTFVMREMNFPLDIVFLNDGKIVKIYRNLPPEGMAPQSQYNSEAPANRVLEFNAGVTREFGLEEGQWLDLPE